MQFDLRTLFIVLVIMYACLGLVCLLLPYRMPGSRAVTYWGYGLLSLAAGGGGVAARGVIPDFVSIVLANALVFVSLIFVLRSVRQGGGQGSDAFGWSVVVASTLLLTFFTYSQPDTHIRIVIASAAMVILLVRPVLALIAPDAEASRRARIFTAACLGGAAVGLLARAILTAVWGSSANFLASDSIVFASYLVFGVLAVLATLGVVWIEIEQLQADLARLATIDSLTGTLNRRAFMIEYERELSRCMREKTGLALVIFDVDHFKGVNDSHGHLAGDQVLRRVVDTLRASLRGHEVLGRYGGEEFALLIPGADSEAATLAAERARLAVGGRPIQEGQLSIPITVSAGVAAYGINGTDWESLLRSADAALYEAKHGGRNRVVVAPAAPGMPAQPRNRMLPA